MQKLLLLSVIFAGIIIPVLAARDPVPRRGFKRALTFFLLFCFCYALLLKYFYFRFLTALP